MSRNSLVDAQEEEKDSRDLSEPVDEEVEVPIPGQHGHCEAQRHVDDAVCEPETEVDENGKLGKATSKVNEKNENLGVFKEDKKTNQTKKLMNVYLRRFLVWVKTWKMEGFGSCQIAGSSFWYPFPVLNLDTHKARITSF